MDRPLARERRRPWDVSSRETLQEDDAGWLALESGAPRHQWETPLEYAPRLLAGFPEAPVDRLTEAFLRFRFGGMEAPLQEAEELDRPLPSARAGRR